MQLISAHLFRIFNPYHLVPLLITLVSPFSFHPHTHTLSLSSLDQALGPHLLFLQMGTCFSSAETESFSYSSLTATVISVNGALHQYPLPMSASRVLGLETNTPSSFFLCNSDNLYFDEYIPPLDSREELDVGQIYFVLPLTRLQYPLTAKEMAGMAVKASVALADLSKKNGQGRRIKRMQISPVTDLGEKVLGNEDGGKMKGNEDGGKMKRNEKTANVVVGRSKSLNRVMSRKMKAGHQQQRLFIATLSTIHEGFTAE